VTTPPAADAIAWGPALASALDDAGEGSAKLLEAVTVGWDPAPAEPGPGEPPSAFEAADPPMLEPVSDKTVPDVLVPSA